MKIRSNDPVDINANTESPCLTADQLAELASGHATGDALEKACTHLDVCSDCQARLESIGSQDPLLMALATPHSPDPFHQELGYRRVTEWLDEEGEDSIPTVARLRVPRRIGKYQVTAHLARGGMGDVYAAVHPDLRQHVAIKVVQPRDSRSHVIDRFRREMSAVAALDHPNIVRALDAGVDGTLSFLVMQLINGIDLGRLCKLEKRLKCEDACEAIRQAALGVQHAHERGLVHRDIKPSNLMLRRDGGVVLLDLGLARWMERGVAESMATTDGQILGTVDYLAPEQGVSHDVDHRADLYGLGATLYKLLSGYAPYDDDENTPLLVKLKRIASETPVHIDQRIRGLPSGLTELVHRCLARDPSDRPSTAGELAKSLGPFCVGNQLNTLGERYAQTVMNEAVPETSEFTETRTRIRMPSRGTFLWSATTLVLCFALLWQSNWIQRSFPKQSSTLPTDVEDSLILPEKEDEVSVANPETNVPVLKQASMLLQGHEACVFGIEFLDDDRLASASWDGTVRLWDLKEREETHIFRVSELLTSLAVSRDGRWLAAGGGVRNTYVWDLDSQELVHRIQHGSVAEAKSGILRLDVSQDSSRLLILTRGGGLWIHDLSSGEIQCSLTSSGTDRTPTDACFVPDNRVAVIYDNQKMSIHDPDSLDVERQWDYTWSANHIDILSFRDDAYQNNLLFTMNSSVYLSNEDGSRRPVSYFIKGERLTRSCVMPGNNTVASATVLRNIYLWDVDTSQTRLQITADSQCTQRIAVSPGGGRIAGGGGWHVEHKLIHDGDYDIRVWELPPESVRLQEGGNR